MKGNLTSSGFPVFPTNKKLQMRDGGLPALSAFDSVTPPQTTELVSDDPIQTYGLITRDGHKVSPDNGPLGVTLATKQNSLPENVTQGRSDYCVTLKFCNSCTLMDPFSQGETATQVVFGRYVTTPGAPLCDDNYTYRTNNNSKSTRSKSSSSTCSSTSSSSSTYSTCNTSNTNTSSKSTTLTCRLDLGSIWISDLSSTLSRVVIPSETSTQR